MPAVGYHPDAEALVIAGLGVFPALSLRASTIGNDGVQIASVDGRIEFSGSYTLLTQIDGTPFASQSAAIAYLNQQFVTNPGTTNTIVGVDGGVI